MFAQLTKHLNPKLKDNIRKKKEIIRRKKKIKFMGEENLISSSSAPCTMHFKIEH